MSSPFRTVCLCALALCLTVVGCAAPATETPSAPTAATTEATTAATSPWVNGDTVAASPTATLAVNSAATHQTVRYFGASGCWPDRAISRLSETDYTAMLDLLFDKQTGIGLTSWRYNVGGGLPVADSVSVGKQASCLESAPGTYDLSRDPIGIRLLQDAVERGAETVTLFANSPPARMTVSGLTSGRTDGGSNLDPACIDDYITYLVDIAALLYEQGIPVTYISPVNEPQLTWGAGTPSQEGCHYTVDEILDIGRRLVREIDRRGLPFGVSLDETARWDDTRYSAGLYAALAADDLLSTRLDHFCGHAYGAGTTDRRTLRAAIDKAGAPLAVHQSEWCSDTGASAGVVELSQCLHNDLTLLDCEAWEFWLGFGTSAWCFIDCSGSRPFPSHRLYALGNYARFITGHTRIDCLGSNDTVFGSAYVSPDGHTLTVIVTNTATTKQTVKLSGLSGFGQTAAWYCTSLTKQLDLMGDILADNPVELPFQSVNTFVFSR